MFKKPPKTLKTSAPLRGSDRRKLRQRIVEIYTLSPDEGNELVPDGFLSQKFTTHSGEPGMIYLGPNGDPLWFSIGNDSDEMIPTVYTLWKHPLLIPWMTTPGIVIEVLARGADMMCPGVAGIVKPDKLPSNALVCIREHIISRQAVGPALVVARMAVDGRRIIQEDIRTGKAAVVLHMVGDKLWEMGSRPAKLPEPLDMTFLSPKPADSGDGAGAGAAKVEEVGGETENDAVEGEKEDATEPPQSEDEGDGEHGPAQSAKFDAEPSVTPATTEPDIKLTPDEVTALLRSSLLQAIQTTLSSIPQSSFPISSSIFYTTYILPARPLYVRPPPPSASSSGDSSSSPPTHTPVDIKHSSHKTLSAFLRLSQSQGLLKLKENRSDTFITAVFPKHPDVEHHRKYRTVGDEEKKERREREKEESEREGKESGKKEIEIEEMWKPHQTSVKLFEDMKISASDLYTLPTIKSHLNTYLTSQNLVNLADQSYINVRASDVLNTTLSTKGTSPPEFMKREELIKAICGKMQNWYRIGSGEDAVVKKGELKPISVIVKIRAGRKACTLITGHEQFGLKSEDIAEALKAKCASSTTVSSLPGKTSGEEVMVQGKQLVAVKEYLTTVQGVPKRWMELTDATVKKKK